MDGYRYQRFVQILYVKTVSREGTTSRERGASDRVARMIKQPTDQITNQPTNQPTKTHNTKNYNTTLETVCLQYGICFTICFAVCLFISPDLDKPHL